MEFEIMKKYPQNLHTHGILCDGRDDYESTILRAMELGFTSMLALSVFPADLLRKLWRRLSGKSEGY